MFASCRAALGYYAELAPDRLMSDYRELSRLALAQDPAAVAAIERQALAIGKGLRMVTAALSPEIILFAGDISYAWTLLLPGIRQECKRLLLAGTPPRLTCTGDGQKAHLLGGCRCGVTTAYPLLPVAFCRPGCKCSACRQALIHLTTLIAQYRPQTPSHVDKSVRGSIILCGEISSGTSFNRYTGGRLPPVGGTLFMFLGIDCGTQGTKALLVDGKGSPRGRGYAPHQLIERPTGAREQDPAWWVEALIASIKQAVEQAGPESGAIHALGVSGQQHGLVVLDADYTVIRPAKLWNDTETAAQNTELIERLGGRETWFERFGVVPLTGYTVSKLLWLQQSEPENFARIRHILLPHEYLNWWLTGVLRAEPGDASGTAFFDNRTRQWLREVLDSIDGGSGHLFAALPPLMDSGEIVGTIRPQVAGELGIDPKCVVAAGGGDNMMGAIGTGNVREGIVTLSLGTSSTVYSFSEKPVEDPTWERGAVLLILRRLAAAGLHHERDERGHGDSQAGGQDGGGD